MMGSMLTATPVGITVALVMVGLLLVVAYQLGALPHYDREQRFAAATMGDDSRHIYYLERNSAGVSWGPGVAGLTPPAAVFRLSQNYRLVRASLVDGTIEELREWVVPEFRGFHRAYRGELFGDPEGSLNWRGELLEYRFSVGAGSDSSSPRLWSSGELAPKMLIVLDQALWSSELPEPTERSMSQPPSGMQVMVLDYRGILLVDRARSLRQLLLLAEDTRAPQAASLAAVAPPSVKGVISRPL